MNMLKYIPVFFYLLIVYNIVAFFGGDGQTVLNFVWLSLPLISGAVFSIDVGHVLIMLGAFSLYIEIFRATRATMQSVIDHTFSMIVFVVYLIEFIVVKQAGTAPFLILTLMSFLDVIAGFTVTISSARRDISVR